MKKMTSTDLARIGLFFSFVLTALTLIPLYFNFKVLKAQNSESETSFANVNKTVTDKAEEAINKITETSNRFEGSLSEKSAYTFKLLDQLNDKIISSSNRMEVQFESLKNPLFPCQIMIHYELDYSSADPEQYQPAEDLRKCLIDFGDFQDVIVPMTMGGKLPWLVMSPQRGPDQYNHIAFRDTINLNSNDEKDFDRRFSVRELQFISRFLTPLSIMLHRTRKIKEMPESSSDLVIDLNSGRKNVYSMQCEIFRDKKFIKIDQTMNSPIVTRKNGSINSLIDCLDGFVGIGLMHGIGVSVKNPELIFKFGPNYSLTESITFKSKMLSHLNNSRNTYFAATFR